MSIPLNEQQSAILKIVLRAKPSLRNELLKHADKELVRILCECVLNILNGNIPINDKEKKKLCRYKNILRSVVRKTKCWKKKRTIIQRGGKYVVPILAPIIGRLLSSIFDST